MVLSVMGKIQCKFDNRRDINMKFLILLFVVILQVWTVSCIRCVTKSGDMGHCMDQNECNAGDEARPLKRCDETSMHCCPTHDDVMRVRRTVSPSQVDPKFPTDCGYTPMYPKQQIVGGKTIRPDEYSWLGSLQYGDPNKYAVCGGSVINSRYVLTAAHCVTGKIPDEAGGLIGVRLGAFGEDGKICDYGTENCTIYQQFGVDEIIVHSDYISKINSTYNDIALIRLDRSIRFIEKKMKPICLPFGSNHIREPTMESILTISGWGLTMEVDEVVAKREATIFIVLPSMCLRFFDVDDTHLCAIASDRNSCNGDSGGPLMQQFLRRRMVLEGIASYGFRDCKNTNWPGVYTRVRSYGNWLEQNMRM